MAGVPHLSYASEGVFVRRVGQDGLVAVRSNGRPSESATVEQAQVDPLLHSQVEAARPAADAARRLWRTAHAAVSAPVSSGRREPHAAVHGVVAAGAADAELEGLEALAGLAQRRGRVDLAPLLLVHGRRRRLDPALALRRVVRQHKV